MATRKGILQFAHEDLAITARFETERMEAHELDEAPEVIRWDREADGPVIRQRYVKPTHEGIEDEPALPSGTVGYRWVNEDGEAVPDERMIYVRIGTDGSVERLDAKATVDLAPGERISLRTPGGGGYGDPADRDPGAVERDRRLGKLSAEAARERYGYDPGD